MRMNQVASLAGAIIILAVAVNCRQKENLPVSTEENKAQVQRLIDEAWNKGNLAVVDEILSPNYVLHINAPGARMDLDGYKQALSMYHNALSGFGFTVEDMIAEGDKVVIRWTIRGTHNGEYMGVAATGKDVSVTGIAIRRLENGKIVEEWVEMDRLGLMQQMGAVPSPK